MLRDGTIYTLPDGTYVRAVRMEGNWIMIQMLDGRPYVGVFSFGVRWLDSHGRDGMWLVPCDLTEDDFVPLQPSVPE